MRLLFQAVQLELNKEIPHQSPYEIQSKYEFGSKIVWKTAEIRRVYDISAPESVVKWPKDSGLVEIRYLKRLLQNYVF